MKLTSISLLVAGAGLGKSFLSYHINQGPTQPPLTAAANPLHVMMASNEASPIRMGHAVANAGPGASDFSDGKPKPKMRHLCKNMQKAVQGTASRILALIGLGENTVSVTAPVPEGSITRIQITTGPAPPKVGLRPAVMPHPPVRGSPMPAGQGTPAWGGIPHGAPIWPHPVYMSQQDDRFDGPFLHRAHRALMSLGPWEGRIVAFVLGMFSSSDVIIIVTDGLIFGRMWDRRPCSHVLRPDGVVRPCLPQQYCHRARGGDDYPRVRTGDRSSVRGHR